MSKSTSRLISFHRFVDERGNLSVLDSMQDVPFPIRRVFFIESMSAGTTRGGHAHHQTKELIIAIGGEIEVTLESCHGTDRYLLGEPGRALYVPELNWLTINCITAGTVCLVMASTSYDERDYIRNHEEFRALIAK
jgi:oxalate decarboxylase/phosphoglucose isomerase-like protein (cupin superfamily)